MLLSFEYFGSTHFFYVDFLIEWKFSILIHLSQNEVL